MTHALQSLFETAAAWLGNQLGGAVIYVAPGGQRTAVAGALLGAESVEVVESVDGIDMVRLREVSLPRGEVALPRLKSMIRIDGEDWTTRRIVGVCDGFTTVEVTRRLPAELSKPGYRTR
jgi:hypothetical protein